MIDPTTQCETCRAELDGLPFIQKSCPHCGGTSPDMVFDHRLIGAVGIGSEDRFGRPTVRVGD
jgi:Zn finger protein HypA/HybF involved in hydrogenase expression